MKLTHNQYLKFDQLTKTLQDFAKENPDLCRLSSIGETEGGKPLWLMTITNFKTGDELSKPGFWVDGNTHATELAGCQACVHLIDTLLSGSNSERIKDLLDHTTFYILPRISADGAEVALTTGQLLRSSPEIYPMKVPLENFVEKDMDQDGHQLLMRIPDPSGQFKISDQDPRLMVLREPFETTGQFYHLLPEGEFINFDGFNRQHADSQKFDLNRQAPAAFSPQEYGAGPLPLYLKEARHVAEAFVKRPNIVGAHTHHTFGGFLLRPSSLRDDSEFSALDLEVFKLQGKIGEKVTGYKAYSIFHDFRYNPKKVTTGAWDDWHFDHRGVFSWTTEIWSLAGQAGVSFAKPLEYYHNPGTDNLLKMIRWCDQNLKPHEFYSQWKKFKHDQLGDVEIGGWLGLFSYRNPPPQFLEKELQKTTEFSLLHAQMSPRLKAELHKMESVGTDLFKLQIKIQNSGFLPSHVSDSAKAIGVYRAPHSMMKLSPGQRLIQGKLEEPLKHLTGRASELPWVSSMWGSQIQNSHEELVTYVIQGPGTVTWTGFYETGGHVQFTVNLKQTN